MKRNTIILIIFLISLMAFLGYNYYFEPFRQAVVEQFSEKKEVIEEEIDPNLTATEIIFNRFDEKDIIGQLISWPVVIEENEIDDNDLTESLYLEYLSKKNPGFFTLFGSDISTQSAKLTIDKLIDNNGSVILPWIAVDHEGGSVQRLSGDGFTRLASWNSICKLDRQKTERALGKSALELQDVGIDIVLAPMVDIGSVNGSLKSRICSSNPDLVVEKANIFIKVFQENNILPVLKHFPGIGKIDIDLHEQFAIGRVSIEDVFVYRTLLDLYPEVGVMTSHIGLDNQFAEIPCSLSKDCVGELINNYQSTLVFTDALEMKSAFYQPESSSGAEVKELTLGDVSKKAVMAGNDILIYGPSVRLEQLSEVYDMLIREYNSDSKFKQKVDKSVKKIISYKLGVPVEHEVKYPAIKQD
ncbi:MAG: glycoside hydrolase family 3 protein [Candidatus Pacebacteria bacterium]|nr:glycoside hydrolase family 3 protein [Candidatus Paceibacterota bacterium]